MDAIAIYFRNASFPQTEEIAARHGLPGKESVFLRDYTDWEYEVTEDEKRAIYELLGGMPNCAVLIESRHGSAGRHALELAADLMEALAPAVLDDDFDGLWSLDIVKECLSALQSNTVFSLRYPPG